MDLTAFDPDTVDRKAEQYNIRGYDQVNSALSSFSSRFLPVLTRLVKFCRQHQIPYRPDPHYVHLLKQINQEKSNYRRYQLDHEMLAQLTLEDITPLEYYMIVHEDLFWKGNYSLSWMLDKWYSDHWEQVINDPLQLRLYLKKANLFDELGIIGNVNKYNRKMDGASPELLNTLNQLLKTETDEHIVEEAREVLRRNKALLPNDQEGDGAQVQGEVNGKEIPAGFFSLQQAVDALARGEELNSKSVLLDTTQKEYTLLFELLQSEDTETVSLATSLILTNLHLSMTPFLLEVPRTPCWTENEIRTKPNSPACASPNVKSHRSFL